MSKENIINKGGPSSQSATVSSGGNTKKQHSIDDIIEHMTADLHSYEGKYIVLGTPRGSPQHSWSSPEFIPNRNSGDNRSIGTAGHGSVSSNQDNIPSQSAVAVAQVQIANNRPFFLEHPSTALLVQQSYELRNRNADFQLQQQSCNNGLFGPLTTPRVKNRTSGISTGEGGGEMIGMVDVGGGNYVNVVFNVTSGNPCNEYMRGPPDIVSNVPADSIAADSSRRKDIQQNHLINDTNLINESHTIYKENVSVQPPNRHLIDNLVGNWLPNQSGTYSPFGGTAEKLMENFLSNREGEVSASNLHQNRMDGIGIKVSPLLNNNSGSRKPRAVAEVKPMRPTYSDVLTKSPPSTGSPLNNGQGKISTGGSITVTQSGNSTPKLEPRTKHNKTNKSGGTKETLTNTKNNMNQSSSFLKRQLQHNSDDGNERNMVSDIHKWMSIEELNPGLSSNEQSYTDNILDGDCSITRANNNSNYDFSEVNNKRSDKKQKRKSKQKGVTGERDGIESMDNDNNRGEFLNNNDNGSFGYSGKRQQTSYQLNSSISKNRPNSDKNSSKFSKKCPNNKDESKTGPSSLSSSGQKRMQRSGKRRNCQTYIGVLWNKWQFYMWLFAVWFFYLLWDVLALSSRLFLHLVFISFEYVLSLIHQSKRNFGQIFRHKTSSSDNNKFNGNRSAGSKKGDKFKSNGHNDNFNKKKSWWKFWDRNNVPPVPDKNNIAGSGGLTNNMAIPTTGDEAIRRLLSCKGKDPYSILGVTRQCTDDDIKKYYKRQAVLVHPDKNSQPGAEEAFKILVHAFELIGEPERRNRYDHCVAETHQMEHAWTELNDLLSQLHQKMEYTANTIRCTNCGKRHRRVPVQRPCYAARFCAQCKIHHSAREGDIWAESWIIGFVWHYYACMEGQIYDITEWAQCQADNLQHLKANSHAVQYRIVLGKQQQHSSQNNNPQPNNNSRPTTMPPQPPSGSASNNPQHQQRQSEPGLEEFLSSLYSQANTNGMNQGPSDNVSRHRRKTKRKK